MGANCQNYDHNHITYLLTIATIATKCAPSDGDVDAKGQAKDCQIFEGLGAEADVIALMLWQRIGEGCSVQVVFSLVTACYNMTSGRKGKVFG